MLRDGGRKEEEVKRRHGHSSDWLDPVDGDKYFPALAGKEHRFSLPSLFRPHLTSFLRCFSAVAPSTSAIDDRHLKRDGWRSRPFSLVARTCCPSSRGFQSCA